MKEILTKLGFVNLTGNLWKHKKTNLIIHISDYDAPEDIVKKIYDVSYKEFQAIIRADLGIS